MSLDNCLACCPCPAKCVCPLDICNDVKINGCVSRTEVRINDESPSACVGDQEAILYCWRICVENCSSQVLCHANVALDLRWKILAAGAEMVTDGTIFQNCLLTGLNLAVTDVTTNIPTAFPVGASVFTGFGAGALLFDATQNNQIPPGKWVIEVCAEIQKSQLEALNISPCPDPALFPAVLTLHAEIPINVGCPVNVSTFVGCVPEAVVVAPFPCNTSLLPNLPSDCLDKRVK